MQWHELFIICKTFALIFFLQILAHLIAVEMGDDSLVMDRVPKIGYEDIRYSTVSTGIVPGVRSGSPRLDFNLRYSNLT